MDENGGSLESSSHPQAAAAHNHKIKISNEQCKLYIMMSHRINRMTREHI